MKLLLFHNTTQTKVGNHDVRVLSFVTEEQVLRLQICAIATVLVQLAPKAEAMRTSVHDTAIVNVGNSGHDRTNQVRSIAAQARESEMKISMVDGESLRLEVVSFGAYTVEKLAARAKIETEIKIVGGLMMGAW